MKRCSILFVFIAIFMLAFAMPVSADVDVSAKTFKDVPSGSWYYDFVYDLVNKNIITGYDDGTFRPQNSITRAEIATILARMSKENTASYNNKNTFSDCRSDHWADEYVNWAAAKGIVNGVGNGKFEPNTPITREAICTMVMRYAKYKDFYPAKIEKGVNFNDDAQISNWARDSVYHMQQANIIDGKGGNLFEPQSYATRAECSKIFYFYLRCSDDVISRDLIRDFTSCFQYYGSSCNYYMADFTHDGYEDLFIVKPNNTSADLYIYTSLGGHVDNVCHITINNIAWRENYYLYQDAEGAYLLYYLHDSATGQTVQTVSLFYGTNSYNIVRYRYNNTVNFYFDGSPMDTGIPQAYYNDLNKFHGYEGKSTFLFGCDDQTMVYNNNQSYEQATSNWGK